MNNHDLMGYADRWSTKQGDEIQFKVHCSSTLGYNVQIGRLWGPLQSDGSHPCHFEAIDATCNGIYPAQSQTTLCGSSAVFPSVSIDYRLGFTLFLFFCPTLLQHTHPQTLSYIRLNNSTSLTLQVSLAGELELLIEREGDHQSTSLPIKLAKEWYACGISFCLASGSLTLWCKSLYRGPNIPAELYVKKGFPTGDPKLVSELSITVAGLPKPQAVTRGSYLSFNGLIEYPTVFEGVMSPEHLKQISKTDFSDLLLNSVIASWDFSVGIASETVFDRSTNAAHGKLINQPARGIPGRNWHSDSTSWISDPNSYTAIHFHSDDLIDAEWEVSFGFLVPDNLPSGIFAAKLSCEDTHYFIPFIVRAGTNKKSRVAFLVSTATYIAYQNHRSRYFSSANERLHGRLNILDDIDLMFIRNNQFGLSTYDRHADGSGVYYSSASRPAFNIKPGGRLWNFAADLLIIKWFRDIGMPIDVLTDEDLHREGLHAVANYDVVLSGSHPEYVSSVMYTSLEQFVSDGGSFMYLGGNGFYWRIAFHSSKRGVVEIRRTEGVRSWDAGPGCYYTSFTGERSGLWRANGKPPQKFLGVGFIGQGFDISSYYRRTSTCATAAWVFKEINSDILGNFGLMLGGAAGLELDAIDYELGTPENTIVLATSENHSNTYELAIEEVLTPHGATDGLLCNKIRSNIVLTRPFHDGGWVFSAGSIAFVGSLAFGDTSNDISRLVRNILMMFLSKKA